ncbi:MAG: hypothetical protein KBT02_12290 [Treponema sp.]|nr:hypothetical protein [Candidatus Treponema caballi]
MYILLTAVLCIALCFGVIYPLWFFSTSQPHLYTVLVLVASVLFFCIIIIRKFVHTYRNISTSDGRKRLILRVIIRLGIFIVILSSILLVISSVFTERRLAALLFLIAGAAVSTVLSRIRKRLADV